MEEHIKCWEYFKCPNKHKNKCDEYQNNKSCNGWYILDDKNGGPAKRGPCKDCEYLKLLYPNI